MVQPSVALIVVCLMMVPLAGAYFSPSIRPPVPTREALDCVYFSGAGIYFWWQAGCAKYLREHCDISKVPVVGASAGSLTSVLLLTGVDFDYAADAALQIATEYGVYGQEKKLVFWGPMLRNWLEMLIPEDVSKEQLAQLKIAISPASPFKAPMLVNDFSDKNDLISAVMASCHIPLLLDGKPFSEYRGNRYMDGSFWYFVTKNRYTGLPICPSTNPSDILWVDYCDDEDFMQSISGNILETVSGETMRNMMQSGYNFMESEHAIGRLPIAKWPSKRFVMEKIIKQIPAQILSSPSRLYSFAFEN